MDMGGPIMARPGSKTLVGILIFLGTRIGKIILITALFRDRLSWWIWALWILGFVIVGIKMRDMFRIWLAERKKPVEES